MSDYLSMSLSLKGSFNTEKMMQTGTSRVPDPVVDCLKFTGSQGLMSLI